MDKTVSSTSRNSAESFSRYLDRLRRRSPVTSSLPVGVAKQQQNSRPPPRCSETSTFAGHRGGDGHYVARLLQPPVSSPETRRILPSNHRLKEVKSIHHSSLFQNGDSLLHYSSPSTTGMDHQNRSKGRVPSHSGPRQHPQILPVRSSWDSLSIPCSSIWALDGSKGIHQDSSSCGPAVTLSRNPGPRVLGRLDHTCKFSRTESGTYTTHYSTSTIIGLDNQLGQINVTTLTNPGLPGFTFQPRTSYYFPSGLVLTNSHQCPIPSISVDGHDCSKSFIHHQQDVTFCPIHIQRPSSPTVSTVLVQSPVVSTSAVVGYTSPVGYGLPHIPALVSKTNSDDRRSVTSSGTQPVLLHGCISQGMGRQLEGQSDFRTMVSSRISTSYKLAGTRSHSTCASSVGSSVATSVCESLLRQQYRSSVHPQTGGNTFSVTISQNPGTVRSPGSVCDNSSTYAPPRSQERHGRCSVPNQSTQPNRMASSNRNLEQSVLCLRNSLDRHVCHSGEQGNALLCFSLPGRQSMSGRRPVPIMGRFGTSICVSSGSHCSQNSPENPQISGHHGHHDYITTSIPTVASTSSPVEHTSSNPSPGRQPVPVCAQPQTPSIPQRSQAIGSSRVELIRDVLKRHHFPDTVVDMAANPLRDSSSNVYNSHWKAFALWLTTKTFFRVTFHILLLPSTWCTSFHKIRR